MTILSLLEIFLILLPGVYFGRKNIIDEKQCEGISSIVVNIAWPCLVITALQMDFSETLLINSGLLAGAFVIISALAYVTGMILCRFLKTGDQITYLIIYMFLFSNTGFMGIPVCETLYGEEGVFYAALMDSLSDIFVFTIGTFLVKKSMGVVIKNNPKELITPGLVSIGIGVGLFLLDIRLPSVLGDTLATVGGITTPLAMFIIGYKLGKMKVKDMLGDRTAYIVSGFRLLVLPAIVLGALVLFGVEMTVLTKVIAMEIAMPVATCTVIFVEQYRGNTAFASKCVLLSTLLSVVTIPVFAMLMEMV
ncbi:MAG: AEC family transporter [Firmicutes bacterium]|nr:AEC family transporter [Bacillota bacterium]